MIEIKSEYDYTRIYWPEAPESKRCIVSYIVVYAVDNDADYTVYTTELDYQIKRIAACSFMKASVWSVSEHSGQESHSNAKTFYTGKSRK